MLKRFLLLNFIWFFACSSQPIHIQEQIPIIKPLKINATQSLDLKVNLKSLNESWGALTQIIKGKTPSDQILQDWERYQQQQFDRYPVLKNTNIWGIADSDLRIELLSVDGYQKLKDWVKNMENPNPSPSQTQKILSIDYLINLSFKLSDLQRFNQTWHQELEKLGLQIKAFTINQKYQGLEEIDFEIFELKGTVDPCQDQCLLIWIKPNPYQKNQSMFSFIKHQHPITLDSHIPDVLSIVMYLNQSLKDQAHQEDIMDLKLDFKGVIDFLAVLQSEQKQVQASAVTTCIESFSSLIDAYQGLHLQFKLNELNLNFELSSQYAKVLKSAISLNQSEIDQITQAKGIVSLLINLSSQRLIQAQAQAQINHFNQLCPIVPFSYLLPIYAFPIDINLDDLWMKEILQSLKIDYRSDFDFVYLQLQSLNASSIFPNLQAIWLNQAIEQNILNTLVEQKAIQFEQIDPSLKHWFMKNPFALSYQQKSIQYLKNESNVLYQLSIGLPPLSLPSSIGSDTEHFEGAMPFLKLYFNLNTLKSLVDFHLHHILNVILNSFKALTLDGHLNGQQLRYTLKLEIFEDQR